MKRLLLFAHMALAASTCTLAQQTDQALIPLSEKQKAQLAAVPEAQFPARRGPLAYPVSVDNSTQPYFRPLFTQVGLECGQASSIGLGFTYEIDWKRNLPANTVQNQYATHFTYNFLNMGSDAGVCFLESWEIVKRCGNPNVNDYGGLASGGAAKWMSGYDKYYNAMHNRITDVAVIYLNTIEGLNTLKGWLLNHMDQSSVGGVANFYSQYTNVSLQLPAGTPEGGKYVITSWGSSPNHSMTILGYNDSIRYDYNSDGQYTNNIDINGDGVVNLKDWEIGGFKIANTYGSVFSWGNQGFSYVMYKSFADDPNNGGIWNNAVYIAFVKQDLTPKLAMKVTLKHTCRNKIKLVAGVAKNTSAIEPEVTLNLPIFDYQGGEKYMQGGTTEADKTIEFGLDATPLLSEIISGQPAKFFLIVKENDPTNAATGQLVSFDLVNYYSGTSIIPSGIANLPLIENGETTVSVTTTLNCSQPAINNTVLPDAKIYEPYSQQMNVSGGTPPYKWRIMNDYAEAQLNAPFPTAGTQPLTIDNSSSGYAEQDLPFAFPYYGKNYTKVYPHVDGYLIFEDHPVPWPYIIYEKTFFKNTRCIAPLMSKPWVLSDGTDGIWYQGNQDSVTFRWRLSSYSSPASTDINISVSLFPDGKIVFYYGNITIAGWDKWIAGLSNGDGLNYHFAAITDSLVKPTANTKVNFTTAPFPTEMSISETGLFSGIPQKTYINTPIRFYAEDNNFLYTTKTINFNTKGVEINYQVNSGGDATIEYGETAILTPILKNVSNITLHNVVMHLEINDPFITLIDSLETIGTLLPGQTVTFAEAFRFSVANSIDNGHLLDVQSHLIAPEDVFNRTIQFAVGSAELEVTNVSFSDGNNNILMPGESGDLLITLLNKGGSKATNLDALLSTIDPYMSIIESSDILATLDANSSGVLSFQIHANSNCPPGHIGFMTMALEGDKDISIADSVYINVGPIIEDYESNNFTRFPWQFSGNANWSTTSILPYEGSYCAQSGTIIDNQESSMFVVMDVLTASEISFYRKVSSENNYDFLYFYLDGAELGKWAGEQPWTKFSFPVTSGVHTFKWVYRKDYSESNGSDKAWVDYISWPPVSDMLLIAYAGPDDNACRGAGYQLQGQVLNASSVLWSSTGDGIFTNNSSPNAIYYPGASDLSNGTAVLTLHASHGSLPSVTDNVLLTIHQGPMASAGPDITICLGDNVVLSQATASYQTSVLWTSSGDGTFDNASLLNPTYTPGNSDISTGMVTLTLTATGNSDCSPVSEAMVVSFFPTVISDAGSDQSIQINTATQLSGSASGGAGTFSASWEPAALLINPAVFNPTTVPLTENQVFTLTAVNNTNGCSSTDQMNVIVLGGPLTVIAIANPTPICQGESSQLQSTGGGGSGNYTYLWSSDPPGFNSALQNPVVSPAQTTVYMINMNDGTSSVSDQVTVVVNPIPSVPQKPQGPVAVNVLITNSSIYTTTGLYASEFSWSFSPSEAGTLVPNGNSCNVNWDSSFSGIVSLSVYASNICGTSETSDTLKIIANHEVSIPNPNTRSELKVYPNPASGLFYVLFPSAGEYILSITELSGKIMESSKINIRNDSLLFPLDLTYLSSGSYILLIQSSEKSFEERLILIR